MERRARAGRVFGHRRDGRIFGHHEHRGLRSSLRHHEPEPAKPGVSVYERELKSKDPVVRLEAAELIHRVAEHYKNLANHLYGVALESEDARVAFEAARHIDKHIATDPHMAAPLVRQTLEHRFHGLGEDEMIELEKVLARGLTPVVYSPDQALREHYQITLEGLSLTPRSSGIDPEPSDNSNTLH